MAFTVAHGLILALSTASMLTVSVANRGWYYGFNYTFTWPWAPKNFSHTFNNTDNSPNKIVVGGSDHWHFGFNYSDWAFENAPFYVNDVLVFKYDPPSDTVFPHSVYLLPNLWSYLTCDLSRAKMIANVTDGGGEGFEFALKKLKPYYFACGERDGLHCKDGRMKFMNFLYTSKDENSQLKAIDFGLSDFVRPDERLNEMVGSAYYVAPEVLRRSYGTEADAVLKADPCFDDGPWPSLSSEAKDFVKHLLNKDPRKRMTAAQARMHNGHAVPTDQVPPAGGHSMQLHKILQNP